VSARAYAIARFRLGRIVSTPQALEQLTPDDIALGIRRHQAGDWGDGDNEANERALIEGTRTWSVYHSTNGVKFWLITEANRLATTVLLPEDY
jgi:hypothetical protein